MPKGQFGARHLQKHLWKLPIPEFDPAVPLHAAIADAAAAHQLEQLRASPEGKAVEDVVRRLLR